MSHPFGPAIALAWSKEWEESETPHFKAYIRVSQKELADLKAYMASYPTGGFTCASGTCKVLNRQLGLLVPFPAKHSPLDNKSMANCFSLY